MKRKNSRTLKRYALSVLLSIISIGTFADNGKWNLYLSYNGETQDIESGDKSIFVQVDNGLYSYNRNDHSICTFNKGNILSDIDVKFIAWANAVKKLVVVYSNGNIDLLCKNGTESENIPDYYNKTTTDDKTINHIYVKDNILLLATNFGILKIDIRKAEIMETYHLAQKIKMAAMDNNYIYALDADGTALMKGNLKKNLVDPSNWSFESWHNQIDFHTVNDDINAEDKAIVETLILDDSPKNNQTRRIVFNNGRLIVSAGGWVEGNTNSDNNREPFLSEYTPSTGSWRHYEAFKEAGDVPNWYKRPVYDITVDPTDPKHVVVGTWGNGIFEFQDGRQINNFTMENTNGIITSSFNSPNYVLALGACFAAHNSLFILSSITDNSLIHYDFKDFKTLNQKELYKDDELSMNGLTRMLYDKERNSIWFVNNHHIHPALFCYDITNNKTYDFSTFSNQDGNSIGNFSYVTSVAKDLESNIWLGTEVGPVMLTPDLMRDTKAGFVQVKVPRNDGTNFADYLLSGVYINCIAIDGGGRKWFGTNGNGVYLISADNMQQLNHFTTDNSLLLDNNIMDIAIDQQTGEVFFSTEKGLCSVMSDATMPNESMDKDNVWAYPNPVEPDYTGDITICGLSINARITITTSSGHLVASGISTGGSFKWNGCDTNGKRVASGIYMVHAATAEGESGVVCKVAVIR